MEIRLRLLKIADAVKSVEWRNDPSIWELTGSRPSSNVSLDLEEDWIRNVLLDTSSMRRAILVGNDEVYVGNIYLLMNSEKRYEYHIFIGDKEYWGKGVAYFASRRLFEEAKCFGIKEIMLTVKKEHYRAIKLYEQLGFTFENEVNDSLIMAMTLEK